MSLDFNKKALIEFLKNQKQEVHFQKETDLVYITLPAKQYEITIFFVFMEESQLLQLIGYFPFQIPEKTKAEVARLLHFLNKQIDMPGFGMDETEGVLFYRSAIPFLDGKIEEKLIKLHLGTLELACETFVLMIAACLQGSVTLSEILKGKKHT